METTQVFTSFTSSLNKALNAVEYYETKWVRTDNKRIVCFMTTEQRKPHATIRVGMIVAENRASLDIDPLYKARSKYDFNELLVEKQIVYLCDGRILNINRETALIGAYK